MNKFIVLSRHILVMELRTACCMLLHAASIVIGTGAESTIDDKLCNFLTLKYFITLP